MQSRSRSAASWRRARGSPPRQRSAAWAQAPCRRWDSSPAHSARSPRAWGRSTSRPGVQPRPPGPACDSRDRARPNMSRARQGISRGTWRRRSSSAGPRAHRCARPLPGRPACRTRDRAPWRSRAPLRRGEGDEGRGRLGMRSWCWTVGRRGARSHGKWAFPPGEGQALWSRAAGCCLLAGLRETHGGGRAGAAEGAVVLERGDHAPHLRDLRRIDLRDDVARRLAAVRQDLAPRIDDE